MDGWMNGGMNGWKGWMDGGWMGELMGRWVGGLMGVWDRVKEVRKEWKQVHIVCNKEMVERKKW